MCSGDSRATASHGPATADQHGGAGGGWVGGRAGERQYGGNLGVAYLAYSDGITCVVGGHFLNKQPRLNVHLIAKYLMYIRCQGLMSNTFRARFSLIDRLATIHHEAGTNK